MPCNPNCEQRLLLTIKEEKIAKLRKVMEWVNDLGRQEPLRKEEIKAKIEVVNNKINKLLAESGLLKSKLSRGCRLCNRMEGWGGDLLHGPTTCYANVGQARAALAQKNEDDETPTDMIYSTPIPNITKTEQQTIENCAFWDSRWLSVSTDPQASLQCSSAPHRIGTEK